MSKAWTAGAETRERSIAAQKILRIDRVPNNGVLLDMLEPPVSAFAKESGLEN